MEKGLQQLRINLVSLEVGRGLVALHMLVEQMRPRLQAILDMANVRHDAIEALKVGAAGPCAQLLNAEDEVVRRWAGWRGRVWGVYSCRLHI